MIGIGNSHAGVGRWVINLLVIAVLGGAGYYNYTQTSEAEDALCALRQDLGLRVAEDEKRVERSETYLAQVRAGMRDPIPGITEADIQEGIKGQRRSIRNQRRTIETLSGLSCAAPDLGDRA